MGLFDKSGTSFKPRYRITDHILNSLTRATADKELIAKVHLPPEWITNFHKEAMLKTAQASASIEGHSVDPTEVHRLAASGSEADSFGKQQVLNCIQVLESSSTFLKDRQLTEDKFLQIHFLLTENALEKPEFGGVYRKTEPVSSPGQPADILWPAPKAKEVQDLVRGLLTWMNSFEAERVHPVLQAGLTHHEIMRVRPFAVGNGLLARYLAVLLLYWRNFDARRKFCLDEYYNNDRNAYFQGLKPSDPKKPDLTGWLEYYADGVVEDVTRVKDRVLALNAEINRKAETAAEPTPDISPVSRPPF